MLLYLLAGGSATQAWAILQLLLQLVPHARAFVTALKKTADGLDAGRTATDLIAPALRGAATKVEWAADAIGGVQVPAFDWELTPTWDGSSFYYVKKRDASGMTPLFDTVKRDLNEAKTELSTAGDKVDDLGKAMTEAASWLRSAANDLGAMLPSP